MRTETLDSGVEMKLIAGALPRFAHKPVEQLLTVAPRPEDFVRHEIIHIKEFSPGETVPHTKTSDGFDLPAVAQKRELITFALLFLHAGDKFRFRHVRTQLRHHGEAAPNLLFSRGQGDRGHSLCAEQ